MVSAPVYHPVVQSQSGFGDVVLSRPVQVGVISWTAGTVQDRGEGRGGVSERTRHAISISRTRTRHADLAEDCIDGGVRERTQLQPRTRDADLAEDFCIRWRPGADVLTGGVVFVREEKSKNLQMRKTQTAIGFFCAGETRTAIGVAEPGIVERDEKSLRGGKIIPGRKQC